MVGVNFITATPTLSLIVFFKKVDSGIALTRVLPRTGIGVHGGLRDWKAGDCRRKILMIVAWLEKKKGM